MIRSRTFKQLQLKYSEVLLQYVYETYVLPCPVRVFIQHSRDQCLDVNFWHGHRNNLILAVIYTSKR